jgi:hypothetical protein
MWEQRSISRWISCRQAMSPAKTEHQPSSERPRAFVLMPIGGAWDRIYFDLIVPALEDAGYRVDRADTLLTQRNVLSDIVRGIEEATLVIAEITTPNPNVLYELGLAQGLNKPTLLIAQELDEVPFDLRSYRIERYSTDFSEVAGFAERLKSLALEHLRGTVEFSSPLEDFLVDRGEKPNLSDRDDGKSAEDSEVEAGILDHLVALEEAVGKLEPAMNEITGEIEVLGQQAEDRAERINQLMELETPSSPREAYRLVLAFANDMNKFSEAVEPRINEVENQLNILIEAGSGFGELIAKSVAEQPDEVVSFRRSMEELLENSKGAATGVQAMRESLGATRGVSRELDRASDDVAKLLDRLLDSFSSTEAFAEKAVKLSSEALAKASPASDSS